jgi:DNA-binding transcriptional ArsR family regulator
MHMTAPPILDRLSALGDETRARILALLERSELTVTELASVLQASQPTVSRHLKTLASEGWVEARVDGRNRHYRMTPSLDETARSLWAIVRKEIGEGGVYAADAERARGVLEHRRLRSAEFFATAAERWDVADLGVGTGSLAQALAPFAGRVIGVDRSREMLAAAGHRLASLPNVDLREGELEALPIGDTEVDVAVLALVLHYVVEPPSVLAEAHRVLRRSGRLLLVDMRLHDRGALYGEEMGHVWPGFEPERVETWLADAGFEAVRAVPLPPDPEATGPLLFLASAAKS